MDFAGKAASVAWQFRSRLARRQVEQLRLCGACPIGQLKTKDLIKRTGRCARVGVGPREVCGLGGGRSPQVDTAAGK